MDLSALLPFWDQLTPEQQARLSGGAQPRDIPRGTVLHRGSSDCLGLLVVRSGRLRAYVLSEEGREITLYRLLERDICLFSASCMMGDLQLDVAVEAERDTKVWVLPPDLYQALSQESPAVANFTNRLMAGRFSEVMWLMEQIIWKSFDRRLAAFLLEESTMDGTPTLRLTHEKIANHLGTAREVVTRMLRYFQSEGMVALARGTVEITDWERLEALARQ